MINSFTSSLKTLLSVSLKILLAVFIYYAFLGIQTYLFNRLPCNLSLIGPLVILSTYCLLKRHWLQQGYNLRYGLKRSACVLAITLLSFFVFTMVYMLVNAIYTHTVTNLFADYTNLLQSIPRHINQWLTIVFAAGMEEILFRFIILSLLIYNGVNRYLAMLLSSVLFAIVHLQYNLYVLVLIVQIGTALSMLYLIFRNLGVAIGMHAAHNYIIDADHHFKETSYTPHSLTEVLQHNVTATIVCCLVILLWIYTQYIRPRLQAQQVRS